MYVCMYVCMYEDLKLHLSESTSGGRGSPSKVTHRCLWVFLAQQLYFYLSYLCVRVCVFIFVDPCIFNIICYLSICSICKF